jgi:transcriptional regulator with XRE-family HTH domain
MPRMRGYAVPTPDTIGGRLETALRDWPLRPLRGWSVEQAVRGLASLARVHVDTVERILDGRTRNPQSAKLCAMAAQLGVSEAWLRWGQEELSLS